MDSCEYEVPCLDNHSDSLTKNCINANTVSQASTETDN